MEEEKTFKNVSITDASKILGKSRETIHNWINKGLIERIYIMNQPFIRMTEIKRVLNELNK
jgi:predicted site-specific integrase-resolvase